MPSIRPKTVRLLDILCCIQQQEPVRLISPKYKIDIVSTCLDVETGYKKIWSASVEGVTVEGGTLTIYIL